jgi:outer membrane immunogenic protein
MRSIFVTAFALGLAGTAYAADLPVRAVAPMAPAPTWTGWYIGINGGGVWGKTDTGLDVSNNIPPAPGFFATGNIATVEAASSNSIKNSGGLAGGQIGYLIQNGPIVAGFEASFDWMGASGSNTVTAAYPVTPPFTFTITQNVKTDWLGLLTARVGWDMGTWYPYLTGGGAVAELKYTNTFIDPVFAAGCTTCTASIKQVKLGAAGGAGVEWKFTNNWSLRGEWLYLYFSGVSGTAMAAPGIPPGTANLNHQANFSENIGRLLVSYRF